MSTPRDLSPQSPPAAAERAATGGAEDGARHPLVAAFFADQLGAGRRPDGRIDPGDEMLRSLVRDYRGDSEQAVLAYFTSGLTITAAYRQILRAHFGRLEAVGRLLDFAGGYGRVTRYLAAELEEPAAGAGRVWMSEIHPRAVAFQRRALGVEGFVSTHRAADLEAPVLDGGARATFDAVLVTSLFTHLPEPSFHAWLRRLVELLEPGGVLVLSAHHPDLLLANDRPAPGRLAFRAESESDVLDTAEYGSTWIDEAFFAAALDRASRELGRRLVFRRHPKGLCAHHDLYVVSDAPSGAAAGQEEPEGPLPFRGQPAIYVENVSAALDGTLSVEGWAADLGGNAPLEEIELAVNGAVVGTCRELSPRPDVAAPRELPEERVWGWRVEGPSPPRAPRTETRVRLKVRTAPGGAGAEAGTRGPGELEHVVFLGSLESLLAVTYRRQAEELGARAERLAGERDLLGLEAALRTHEASAMRESRFWRLRDRWFALKKKLGLIDEIWP